MNRRILNIILFIIVVILFIEIYRTLKTEVSEIKQDTAETPADTLQKKIEYLRNHRNYNTLLNSGMYEITDSILGDFDGNGTREYLYQFSPKNEFLVEIYSDIPDNIFIFSDTRIKPLENMEGCFDMRLENVGDIYFDGSDAILMHTWNRFTSCWSGIDVYTLADTGWTSALEKGGFSIYSCDWEESEWGKYDSFLKADKRKKGFVQITYMDFYDEDIDKYEFGSDEYEEYRWKIKQKWVPLKKVTKLQVNE